MISDDDLAKKLYDVGKSEFSKGNPYPVLEWDHLSPEIKRCWTVIARTSVETVMAECDPLGHVKEVEDRLDKNRAILWQIFDLLKPVLDPSDDLA